MSNTSRLERVVRYSALTLPIKIGLAGFLCLIAMFLLKMVYVNITFDEPQVARALLFAIIALALLLVAWAILGHTTLRFDFASSTLTIEKHHWPMRRSLTSIPIGTIEAAAVESSAGSKGGTVYCVILRTTENRAVPLGGGADSIRGHHDRKAAEINAVLAEWRAR